MPLCFSRRSIVCFPERKVHFSHNRLADNTLFLIVQLIRRAVGERFLQCRQLPTACKTWDLTIHDAQFNVDVFPRWVGPVWLHTTCNRPQYSAFDAKYKTWVNVPLIGSNKYHRPVNTRNRQLLEWQTSSNTLISERKQKNLFAF